MRIFGLLALSGSALGALIVGSGAEFDRDLGFRVVTTESAVSEQVAAVEPLPTDSVVLEPATSAPDVAPLTVGALVPNSEEAAPAPSGIVVPDLSRMRVDRAMRQLHEMGFRLAVRDSWGDPLSWELARSHRIRPGTQSPPAGTRAEPGTVFRARVYELAPNELFASGY